MTNERTRLSMLIDDSDKRQLKEQADKLGLTFSSYVRMLLHRAATSDPVHSAKLFTFAGDGEQKDA